MTSWMQRKALEIRLKNITLEMRDPAQSPETLVPGTAPDAETVTGIEVTETTIQKQKTVPTGITCETDSDLRGEAVEKRQTEWKQMSPTTMGTTGTEAEKNETGAAATEKKIESGMVDRTTHSEIIDIVSTELPIPIEEGRGEDTEAEAKGSMTEKH